MDYPQRLDFWIDPIYKPRHVEALVQLSEASARYPSCISLKGVGIESGPVSGDGFGDVYRGRLGGQNIALKVLKVSRQNDKNNLRQVNLLVYFFKQPQPNSIKETIQKFQREAVTWRQLSHPNVLQYLGVYHLDYPPKICLVAPWMENGNVLEYLELAPNTNCVPLVRFI